MDKIWVREVSSFIYFFLLLSGLPQISISMSIFFHFCSEAAVFSYVLF